MVKKREPQQARTEPISDEDYLEAPAKKWEQEADAALMSVEERLEHREKQGPKRSLMPVYGNEEHKNLIDKAAKAAGVSKQKLLRDVLYEGLEQRYGRDVPFIE